MKIELFSPKYDIQECLKQIQECLECGWTGLGYKTIQFEEAWKEYTGFENALFLNSATAGLCLAVDIFKEKYNWSDGDEIITTPLTFVSTSHAILLAGLKPVFADVDDTLCVDPAEIDKKITSKTRAVMYVGLGGNSGHYGDIVKQCEKYKLKLILDAAHMAGTRVNYEIPGKEADAVIYSFQAVKNLPTSDSGMVCFRDKELHEIARKKSWLGINKDTYSRRDCLGHYKWQYDVEYVGYKYNGNSIAAAIGIAQLKHLDADNLYRRQIADWYMKGFAPYSEYIKFVDVPLDCQSSQHLFQIIIDNRDALIERLNKKGIYLGVHYIDITRYRMYEYAKGSCPKASYVSDHVVSLPMHLNLSYEDVQKVITEVLTCICMFQKGLNYSE